MLKPLDLCVLLYLIAADLRANWTQVEVAQALGVSQSMVHRSIHQLQRSTLLSEAGPLLHPLRGLLVSGVRYVYPARLGAPARGLRIAHSPPAFGEILVGDGTLVWPCDAGQDFGPSLVPLHPCVPTASLRHADFYELMALVDVLRVGRVREVQLATARVDELLRTP